MSIKLGDKNKIKNSNIGHQVNSNNYSQSSQKNSFAANHPILISVAVTFLFGFLFLFSFWQDIVTWIESMF
ncbi:hypothetical protein [Planococcus beigongshangi]|uniref:hypothetical protein n=1 Tax=Planococcus beigongshangi TaxID=2782536 RepID=UPI001EEEF5F2|nr:hypothetical protein [Planococcus beigongshangi]